MHIRLLSKFHLLGKIVLFSRLFIALIRRLDLSRLTQAIQNCQQFLKIGEKISNFLKQSEFRKKSIFFLLGLFLIKITNLCGSPILQEGNLQIRQLPNGVETWVRENNHPSQMVSLRVIWNKQEIPRVYALDCPYEELDEIENFFDFCREKIECSSDQVAVIAVGDCSTKDLFSLIEKHFQDLPHYETDLAKPPIAIRTGLKSTNVHLAFMYPTTLQKLQDLTDLKQQWVIYFLQQMIQERLQNSLKDSKGEWIPQRASHFLLPKRFCYGIARCMESNALEVLGGFLLAIQEIKKGRFEDSEFDKIKTAVQKTLLSLHHGVPGSGTLATYFTDQCTFGMGCPSYDFFMAHSQNLVAEITLNDIHDLARGYLLDERRRVELIGGETLGIEKEQVQEVLDLFQADGFTLELDIADEDLAAGFIGEAPNAYALLPITEGEADTIRKIIETMANNNPIILGLKKGDLEKKGKKINHVHPLRFLGTIFSSPDLKICMKEIRSSYFKWNGFLNGLSGRLSQEYARNNLLPYVAGFSQAVKANPDQVRSYLQKRDWEGFVKYLLKGD